MDLGDLAGLRSLIQASLTRATELRESGGPYSAEAQQTDWVDIEMVLRDLLGTLDLAKEGIEAGVRS
jgi:hypothetical protein